MFISIIMIIAKKWKQSKCLSIEGISEMCYIHTTECYSAIKKNEVVIHAATWINILNERSQLHTKKPHIWYDSIYVKCPEMQIYSGYPLPGEFHGQEPGRLQSMGSWRVRHDSAANTTMIESKLIVTRDWGDGGGEGVSGRELGVAANRCGFLSEAKKMIWN